MLRRSANCSSDSIPDASMTISCEKPLRELVGDRLKLNEPLSRYTVARLGGPADALVSVDSAEVLAKTARIAWEHHCPVRILGGGANVLISDLGYRGLIIVNNAKNT